MERCGCDYSEELIDGNYYERFASSPRRKDERIVRSEHKTPKENEEYVDPFILRGDSL